jgi:hypothetical protein
MSKDYSPIPGVGTGRGSLRFGLRTRIYAAADHLLLVETTGYTEDYKRISYRDIRYVVARENSGQVQRGLFLLLIIFLICLLNFAGVHWLIVGIFCFPFVVVSILNLARGACCDCFLSTNVQTLKLPTPNRMNKVPKFVDFLKTKISSEPVRAENPVAPSP